MFNSVEASDDSPGRKFRRAIKRSRGKQNEEATWEPGEHSHYVKSIRKRRSTLSLEDTGQQISSYFESD